MCRILEFAEAYMVDYCLRRETHQIDGNEVIVTKALPKFDEEEPEQEESGDVDDKDAVQDEGDHADVNEEKDSAEEVKEETSKEVENEVPTYANNGDEVD